MNKCTYNIERHYPQYHAANFPREKETGPAPVPGYDGNGDAHDSTLVFSLTFTYSKLVAAHVQQNSEDSKTVPNWTHISIFIPSPRFSLPTPLDDWLRI